MFLALALGLDVEAMGTTCGGSSVLYKTRSESTDERS